MPEQLLKLAITTLLVITFSNSPLSADVSPRIATIQPPIVTKDGENPMEIARQITVRILANPGSGSGVIVGRHQRTYTILTNNHVVLNTWYGKYKVVTADGLSHPAKLIQTPQFKNLDLAIIQFSSSKNYRVTKIAKSDTLLLGQTVYASGFPNWYWVNSRTPISTINWGLKAFKLTTGEVGMFLDNPLSLGYQIGYTNDIENGMSGGPVIDSQGYLIGINGRLKHPFNGIYSYRFPDRSMPSQEQFLQMRSLSWAIPITNYKQINN